MSSVYSPAQPERSAIDAMPGVTVLDFGTDWCGHCRAAAALIAQALAAFPDARHIKIEDGSGRVLGRSFKVKLWPTIVVIKEGKEVARVVRPDDAGEVRKALET